MRKVICNVGGIKNLKRCLQAPPPRLDPSPHAFFIRSCFIFPTIWEPGTGYSHLCHLRFNLPVKCASHANFSQHTSRYKDFPLGSPVKQTQGAGVIDTSKLTGDTPLSWVCLPLRKGYDDLVKCLVPTKAKQT